MTAVSLRYDAVINDLNEQNVRFLADNPNCGLNTIVRLRTDRADAVLKQLSALQPPAKGQASPDMCLSAKEWEALDDYLDTHRNVTLAMVAPERKLLILSRRFRPANGRGAEPHRLCSDSR